MSRLASPAYHGGMRQWVQRNPRLAIALALLVEWVVLAAGYRLIFGNPLLDAVIEASLWTFFAGIALVCGLRRNRRVKAHLEEKGQIRAYLRYPDSLPGSLSGIWNMGIATRGQGRIDFQPAVYDTLEPSGRPTRIQVLEVLPGRRPISREDRKYMGGIGILQVISLLTDHGRVEIAASPDSLSKLIAAPPE
jgi:hypothetical protein